jgi:hypothetical protein
MLRVSALRRLRLATRLGNNAQQRIQCWKITVDSDDYGISEAELTPKASEKTGKAKQQWARGDNDRLVSCSTCNEVATGSTNKQS